MLPSAPEGGFLREAGGRPKNQNLQRVSSLLAMEDAPKGACWLWKSREKAPASLGEWRQKVPASLGEWRQEAPASIGEWHQKVPASLGEWHQEAPAGIGRPSRTPWQLWKSRQNTPGMKGGEAGAEHGTLE